MAIPFFVLAAAELLANNQRKAQAQRDAYQQQLERVAAERGANTDLARVYDDQRSIGEMSANYGPILQLAGKAFDSEPSPDEYDDRYGLFSRRNYGKP